MGTSQSTPAAHATPPVRPPSFALAALATARSSLAMHAACSSLVVRAARSHGDPNQQQLIYQPASSEGPVPADPIRQLLSTAPPAGVSSLVKPVDILVFVPCCSRVRPVTSARLALVRLARNSGHFGGQRPLIARLRDPLHGDRPTPGTPL